MASGDDSGWGKFLVSGFEVAVGVGLGCVVGTYIDRKFGCAPWGLLGGLLVGCSAGMYILIKDAIRINKD